MVNEKGQMTTRDRKRILYFHDKKMPSAEVELG
jgi:hypothetical protein